jgi:cysteinyl-tRNA synthetase
LRDLALKGYKPSSIRLLLASVPYRHQLNFTFDGLKQMASNVDKLRNFQLRLKTGQFPSGAADSTLAQQTVARMTSALEDDLNTAQAQAAIFDMVRKANAAIDSGQMRTDDVAPLLAALDKFDQIFAVLRDDDAPKMKTILEWAKTEGHDKDVSPELLDAVGTQNLSDAEIEGKIAAMEAARRSRDFHASDAIRAELTSAGLLVEITKDGVRWRRK